MCPDQALYYRVDLDQTLYFNVDPDPGLFPISLTTQTSISIIATRAEDPHSFFTDPYPAVLLDAEPTPAPFLMRIRIQL